MKKFADLWWLVAIATVIAYLFLSDALGDLKKFNDDMSGFSGFASGFLHGLVMDLGYVGRVDDAQAKLVSRALFWQNIYRLFLLAAIVSAGAKLYFRKQQK